MYKEDKQEEEEEEEKKHGKRDEMSLKCPLGYAKERWHTVGEIVENSLEWMLKINVNLHIAI